MAEEVPEEVGPPRLTAEDVERGIVLAREERENLISLARDVPATHLSTKSPAFGMEPVRVLRKEGEMK